MTLTLLSATFSTASEIEITYSALPKATGRGTNDALLVSNYSITGPGVVRVVEVLEILTDLTKFKLILAPGLVNGTWTVTARNVETATGDLIEGDPIAFSFTSSRPTVIGPQAQETGYDLVAQCIPSAFQGEVWEALKKALGWSAQKLLDYGRWASDQLFLESSSGRWLDKRALEIGAERPPRTGIEDGKFRRLAETLVWGKLTGPGLWNLLDVFYGPDLTRAIAIAELSEPYALEGGEELWLEVGGIRQTDVVIDGDILDTAGSASADSVAAALNYEFEKLSIKLYADVLETEDGRFVRVSTRDIGIAAKIRFLGGSGQTILRFPTRILAHDSGLGGLPTWDVTTVPLNGSVEFTCSDPTGTDLSLVQPGDYAVISDDFLPANQGTFEVLAVSVTGAFGARTQVIELANPDGVAEAGIIQTAEASLLFFRPDPVKQDPYGPTITQAAGRLDIALPVSSRIVDRNLDSAGYVRDWTYLAATATRLDSTLTVTTTSAHGLSEEDAVEFFDPIPDYTAPTVTAGGAGLTDHSPLSVWSDLTDMADAKAEHGVVQLQSGDVLVCGGTSDLATYLDTAQRFRVTSDTTLAGGRRQLGYSWVATAVIPNTLGRFSLTYVPFMGLPALVGGWDGAIAVDTAYLYDEVVDTWTALPGVLNVPRYNHSAVVVDSQLIVIGGNDGATVLTGCEFWDFATGGPWDIYPALTYSREQTAAVVYQDGAAPTILVCGGLDQAGDPRAITDVYDTTSGDPEFTRVGDMAWARYGHTLVALSDGRVLAIGGYGRPVNDTSVAVGPISAVEQFDPVHRSWSQAGDLSEAMAPGFAALLRERVFVGAGGSERIARADFGDGIWRRSAASPDISPISPGFAGTDWFLVAGGLISATPTAEARLLVPAREEFVGARLPDIGFVSSVPSPTTFEIEQPGIEPNSSTWTSLTIGSRPYADEGEWLGPYAFSPHSGMMPTTGDTTLAQDIEAGHQYLELQVAAALDNTVEWIGVDVGGDLESGPVRYLGKSSATTMRIDYDFVWPLDIPSGTKLSALVQMAPYEPTQSEHVAYAVASDAATVAAKKLMEEASAGGFERQIVVKYPNDSGMGAEGWPSSGTGKLSDQLVVWSGE